MQYEQLVKHIKESESNIQALKNLINDQEKSFNGTINEKDAIITQVRT